jgi:hypothetical protein
MLAMNSGCSPHFKQRGDVGLGQSCFSMATQNPATGLRATEQSR